MVKGLSRRVVVVKSPDKRFFEEAIFILKEDAQTGVSAQDVVAQAEDVISGYISENSRIRGILRKAGYITGAVALGMLGYFLAGFLF